jgi:hypothetical protein
MNIIDKRISEIKCIICGSPSYLNKPFNRKVVSVYNDKNTIEAVEALKKINIIKSYEIDKNLVKCRIY